MEYADIESFHGHSCPGLAIGYRMAQAGLEALASVRADDEELVAMVENDACGVDALQMLTGCTFGKGNLLFRDHGKLVYTIYRRAGGQGVRVVFHGRGVPAEIKDDRAAYIAWLRSADQDAILSLSPAMEPLPRPARIRQSLPCALCGELVMASRIRSLAGLPACIPCFEKESQAGLV